jgi:hypothetical protein
MMALRYVLQRGGTGYFPEYVIQDHLASGALQHVQGSVDMMLPVHLIARANSASFENVLGCLTHLRGGL